MTLSTVTREMKALARSVVAGMRHQPRSGRHSSEKRMPPGGPDRDEGQGHASGLIEP